MLTRLACTLSAATLLSACFLPSARAAGPDQAARSIIHEESPQPAIHGPRIVGSTPGRPFLFLIPATGEKPLHFAAKNLPEGLTLDPETGIITGSLKQSGSTVVEIEVKNARGSAKRDLTIVGGQHKLALTPPMGWNSWNCWAGAVSDAKVRAAADAMVGQRPGRPRLPIRQHRRLLGRQARCQRRDPDQQ